MLDINLIREQPEVVRKGLKDRQLDASPVDSILQLDEKRRALLTEVEKLKALTADLSSVVSERTMGDADNTDSLSASNGERVRVRCRNLNNAKS